MSKSKHNTTPNLKLNFSHSSDLAWYISFYQLNPSTGKRERLRFTFDMNRIKDLKERYQFAMQKLEEIRELLPAGYPWHDIQTVVNPLSLDEAMDIALKVRCNTDRGKSINSYSSYMNVFCQYAERLGWSDINIEAFTKKMALEFMDYITIERGVGASTYNNYMTFMRSFFMVLKDREMIKINPFSGIKERKVSAKQRRALSAYEKKMIIDAVFESDKMLMLAILLIYCCFIRPTELRRLRFRFFDLQKGVINMPGEITKNRESSIVTIPDEIIDFMVDYGFHHYHSNLLIFGKNGEPNHHIPIGEHTLNNRHRSILHKLKKKGILNDIKGLSLYSWKDTGAMDMIDKGLNVIELKNQIRHKDLSVTQVYLTALSNVNENIKKIKLNILPK